jgi:hypothetical protein
LFIAHSGMTDLKRLKAFEDMWQELTDEEKLDCLNKSNFRSMQRKTKKTQADVTPKVDSTTKVKYLPKVDDVFPKIDDVPKVDDATKVTDVPKVDDHNESEEVFEAGDDGKEDNVVDGSKYLYQKNKDGTWPADVTYDNYADYKRQQEIIYKIEEIWHEGAKERIEKWYEADDGDEQAGYDEAFNFGYYIKNNHPDLHDFYLGNMCF